MPDERFVPEIFNNLGNLLQKDEILVKRLKSVSWYQKFNAIIGTEIARHPSSLPLAGLQIMFL